MKRRELGVTLIELLVTLTVLAILLAVAVPNLSNLIASNRASAQLSLAINAFNYARSEAVRRGRNVYISPQDTSATPDWKKGWRIWISSGHPGASYTSGDTVLQTQAPFLSNTTLTGFGAVGFTGTGALIADGATANGSNNMGTNNEYQFQFTVPDSSSLNRIISINAIGRISVQ